MNLTPEQWAQVRADIAVLANTEYPREACGFLMLNVTPDLMPGEAPPDGGVHVIKVQNVDDAPWYRFRISDDDVNWAIHTGRCIGVWHTHPSDPAVPSEVDEERAVPSVYHIIYAVQDEDLAIFTLQGGRLVPETLVMPS